MNGGSKTCPNNYNVLFFNEIAFVAEFKYKYHSNSWIDFDMFVLATGHSRDLLINVKKNLTV